MYVLSNKKVEGVCLVGVYDRRGVKVYIYRVDCIEQMSLFNGGEFSNNVNNILERVKR